MNLPMDTDTQTPDSPPLAAVTGSAFERVIAALLTPTVETMRLAGISRLTVEGNSVLLQMTTGEVIGLLPIGDARLTLGTFIAWSAQELGEQNVRRLLDMMEPNDQTLPTPEQDSAFY
jgi:hypothetical protein